MHPDDPWQAPSARLEAPSSVPAARVAFWLDRERLIEAWPAHARQVLLPWRRPDVSVGGLGLAVILLGVVSMVPWATKPIFGLALAGTAAWQLRGRRARWRERAAQVWRQAEGVAWVHGERVSIELGGGALRYVTSRQQLTLPANGVGRVTRVGRTAFLWTRSGTFVPLDATEVLEGDAEALLHEIEQARGAVGRPATGHVVPEGAVRIRVTSAGWVGRMARRVAVTAALNPRLIAVILGLSLAAGAGLARVGLAPALLAGGVGLLAGLGFVAAPVATARALWRHPGLGWVDLGIEGGRLHVGSPVDGFAVPADRITRVRRWSDGTVWVELGRQVVFVPRRVLDGDRDAFLAALQRLIDSRTAPP